MMNQNITAESSRAKKRTFLAKHNVSIDIGSGYRVLDLSLEKGILKALKNTAFTSCCVRIDTTGGGMIDSEATRLNVFIGGYEITENSSFRSFFPYNISSRNSLPKISMHYFSHARRVCNKIDIQSMFCKKIETDDFPINISITVIYPNILIIGAVDLFNTCDTKTIYYLQKRLCSVINTAANILSVDRNSFLVDNLRIDNQSFIKLIMNDFQETKKAKLRRMKELEDQIANYKSKIAELEVELSGTQKAIDEILSIEDNIADKLRGEETIIAGNPMVEKVDFYNSLLTDNCISVLTKDIFIKCQKTKYFIGKILIKIDLLNKQLCFSNESGLYRHSAWGDRCPHPHISESGHPCYGNINTQISDLLLSYDIAFLVSLCISYLQSVNIRDIAGKNIVNWPHINEETGEIVENDSQSLTECSECGALMPTDDGDNEGWAECHDCGRWVCPSCQKEIVTNQGERKLCPSCYKSLYKFCEKCERHYYLADGKSCEVCGETHCPDCADSSLVSYPQKIYGKYRNHIRSISRACATHTVCNCDICNITSIDLDNEGDCVICGNTTYFFKCECCGKTLTTNEQPYINSPICMECNNSHGKCAICGTYDLNENLFFDTSIGILAHPNCYIAQQDVSAEENNEGDELRDEQN